ncbi:hypothetical protein F5X68DRAFT_259783 [Plectosphaerella plurivora]|uniref:Uncharacterized protein n=1 Tax=Plectosphaerella plurivora TaxID=936078 RepID=A0A9P8VGG3_9PEZI|nr:hypothetical protein F5X68DRAFT_259783 [Plectosphaerella plurivora]
MAFNSALARRLYYFATLLLLLVHPAVAINLAELKLHAQDLNTTDLHDVRAFISRWEVLSRGNTKGRQYPPLASQVPVAPIFELGKVRRQEDPSCTWRGGGFCLGDGKCCGPVDNGWCCPGSEFCCQGGSSTGCCGSDGFCCGSETGFDAGECCSRGQTCCVPSEAKPFCCDDDQTCNNSGGECINPTVTITLTTTRWSTRTQTEAFNIEATTLAETTITETSTRHTTISNVDIATLVETRTVTVTHEPTGVPNRRHVLALATPTPLYSQSVDPDTTRYESSASLPSQVFVIRPAPSLDALAKALARRGVPIERRATVTNTAWRTVESTTTSVLGVTSTEWKTQWDTVKVTDTTTVTTFFNAKETVTEWTTTTRHVTLTRTSSDVDDSSETATSEQPADTSQRQEETAGSTNSAVSSAASSTSSGSETNAESGSSIAANSDSNSNGPPLATIIGASVGGSVGLILIALIAFCLFWRRYRNKAATAAATGHLQGPPFMLPSEHSVSPPGLSSTPGTVASNKGGVMSYHSAWDGSPMQELSPSTAAAELRGGRSPYPSPAAPNTQFGYQPFDHYNQGYYVPPGNHPQDVPDGSYPSQDRYRGQMLELPGGQGLNEEQPGQAPRTT